MTDSQLPLPPTVIQMVDRSAGKLVARSGEDGRTEIVRVHERANQKRRPNFQTDDGTWCMVRCFTCGGERGRENYAMAVASGQCAWCGDKIEGDDE